MNINRMRQSFAVATVWMCWSVEDQAEYGDDIKAAINAKDEARLSWWAAYLDQASGLDNLGTLCRAAETRIRADYQAMREAA